MKRKEERNRAGDKGAFEKDTKGEREAGAGDGVVKEPAMRGRKLVVSPCLMWMGPSMLMMMRRSN